MISIREIENKSDPVILEIPNCTTERISKDDGTRIMLEDVNFDGHKDILYLGDNNGLYLFHRCIGFLWNEETGKYELCRSLPSHFGYIDSERKRLTYYDRFSIYDETYYIYEYNENKFREKRLEMELMKETPNPGEHVWNYYENGELLEKLILEYSNGETAYYTFYSRDNQVINGEFLEEKSYSELGMQYFPEFDTVNLADATWAAWGGNTLSKEVTDSFARKVLECRGGGEGCPICILIEDVNTG